MKLFFPVFLLSFLFSCGGNTSNVDDTEQVITPFKPIELFGNTQGTTFAILCNDPIEITMEDVTKILANYDDALSGYIPSSTVSKLNNSSAGIFEYTDPFGYFEECYEVSQDLYALTNGDFDPSVHPLVDGWGFLKNLEVVPDSSKIDSLLELVSFQNGYHFDYLSNDSIHKINKKTPGAKLDFNAVAQGLAVDVLAKELEKRGAQNYFVEIGGEIRVNGLNFEGETWRIGIDKPIENSTEENRVVQEVIHLENQSIATSGSYRKFYEKNGIKYSHTINPKTGYPVTHSLLSTTVVAASCGVADALATAFLVMGHEKAIVFIDEHPELDIEVYFVFINNHGNYETYYTKAFGDMIIL